MHRDAAPGPATARSTRLAIAIGWGIGGVAMLLTQALVRLTPRALEAIDSGLSWPQWLALGGWVGFMAHAEGLRGFHRRFSPRVVARALVLAQQGTPLQLLLAPAYCMSLLHASRRGRVVAWSVVAGIAALVAIVSRMAQPWRGIVDAGVVAGLGIGLGSLLLHTVRAMAGRPPTIAPDLPVTPATDGSS